MLNASYLSLSGFREHSRAQNVLLTGKLTYRLSPTSSLTTLMSFMDAPFADDPGGITRAQVEADREQARDRNVLLDSGERVTHGRLGFVYRNEFLPGHEITVTQYSVFRQFDTKLPILPRFGSGVVKFDRAAASSTRTAGSLVFVLCWALMSVPGLDAGLTIPEGISASAASTRTKMCAALVAMSSICVTISSSVLGCGHTLF